ncbi:MAG: DNA mismatch repair protein MutS [Chloroflexota bacterium]|nr:DNA mismatch repair protein MutS [Chloroflexota bacterium]
MSRLSSTATPPLRRQYLEIKRRFPQAIVFFRLGDFYETFDQDAEVVARELEIALTSRPIGKGSRIPLAGIPHHALDSYLAKLIGKGYKVAICEQMGEGVKGRTLMERQVVRVVTPGTLVEGNLLDQRANNYLAALASALGGSASGGSEGERAGLPTGQAGLAYVDVSTGEFAVAQLEAEAVHAELDRLRPAELLLPDGVEPPAGVQAAVSRLDAHHFDPQAAADLLLAHFSAASLEAFGCAHLPLAVAAAGAILAYLQENQRAILSHITRLSTYSASAFMTLDSQTRRNLELFTSLRQGPASASLLSTIDLTRTAMGARLLRRWLGQPSLDITSIHGRQERVQFFFESAVRRGQMTGLLARMPDLERLLGRISAAVASPREVVALRRGLELVPALRQAVAVGAQHQPEADPPSEDAAPLLARLHPCQETAALIRQAIEDEPAGGFEEGGVIRPGFSPELDSLRSVARDARQYLADLERRERQQTGIKSLKVGYNKVFGYYIEVSKPNLKLVPAHYQRRQTLVGGERFTTAELKEREYQILHARERQEELEATLFRQVYAQVAADGKRILDLAAAAAEVDVFSALAEVAARYGYTRPEVTDDGEIVIRDGRHPVVERMLPEGAFVPNDTHLSSAGGGSASGGSEDTQIVILTGPNMAGKSTYIRQVALIVLLAQIGSFVPVASARIGVVDRIFTRVGALDDIAAGQSTFLVEMLETAAILHNATPRSLLLFDEIGRGTSTYDGMAIARAVVEFIHHRPEVAAKTLFATHYHELVDLAAFLPRVKNYNVAVAEEKGRVVFLHRILPGGADRSYGIHVAQLAGLPRPVIQRAQEVLSELEEGRDRHDRARQGRPRAEALQLSFLGADPALAEELAALDVDSLTPLQAITKLYELRERARGKEG